jgi:hypothetical protein
MGNLLYRCMTKGTKREDSEPRYSQNWVLARRGVFCIFENKVTCGDWTINFSDVTKLTFYKTRQLLIPVKILHFTTVNGNYQFGFNPWAKPEKYLIKLNPEQKTVKLKYSKFSIILRITILVYLLIYFITKLIK